MPMPPSLQHSLSSYVAPGPGVYQDVCSFPGLTVFLVYNDDLTLIRRGEIASEYVDEETVAELTGWFERHRNPSPRLALLT